MGQHQGDLPLHDGANINAAVTTLVALTHNADSQEVHSVWNNRMVIVLDALCRNSVHRVQVCRSLTHIEGDSDDVERHGGVCNAADG